MNVNKNVIAVTGLALIFLTVNQASAQSSSTPSPEVPVQPMAELASKSPSDPSIGVPLWRGLTTGMYADAVVAQLQKIPEIKEATLNLRKGKPAQIKVKYQYGNIALFGFAFKADFIFEYGILRQVQLNSDMLCAGRAYQNNLNGIVTGLSDRYPNTLTIVDSNGAEIPNMLGFTDGTTQVQLTVYDSSPPTDYEVSRAKLEALLAESKQEYGAYLKRSNASQLETTRKYAVLSCPDSEGEKKSLTLSYTSHAKSVSDRARNENLKEQKNQRDADKL